MHGVLDQAARGVNEIAELAGLNARRVDDVRKGGEGGRGRSRRRALHDWRDTLEHGAARGVARRSAGRSTRGSGDPLGHRLLLRPGRIRAGRGPGVLNQPGPFPERLGEPGVSTASCRRLELGPRPNGTVNRRCFRAALASPLPAFDSRFRNSMICRSGCAGLRIALPSSAQPGP